MTKRNHPVTVFDRPQWKLLPDPQGERMYGNVSNRLEIADGARHWAVALAVPTPLFTYLREIANVSRHSLVTLALDRTDDFHVFAVLVESRRGDPKLFDLWAYPQGGRPEWVEWSEHILPAPRKIEAIPPSAKPRARRVR